MIRIELTAEDHLIEFLTKPLYKDEEQALLFSIAFDLSQTSVDTMWVGL